MDYGFRISEEGKDVKTCTDKECIVTSKYANLKGTLSGGGAKAVPHNTIVTVTIPHGLNYIPFVTMYVGYTSSEFSIAPMYIISSISQESFWCNADSTNVYLKFWQGNVGGDTETFYYKYFIFIDKGKL